MLKVHNVYTCTCFCVLKGVQVDSSPAVSGASAQSLLLCCWHAMKEISLLMGLVVEWAPIGNNSDSLLTREQVCIVVDA